MTHVAVTPFRGALEKALGLKDLKCFTTYESGIKSGAGPNANPEKTKLTKPEAGRLPGKSGPELMFRV